MNTRPSPTVTEVVEFLTAFGDTVLDHPERAAQFPADLIKSARRFVDLTGVHGLPDEQVAVVPIEAAATTQLVLQLIRPGELVCAGALRERLSRRMSRDVPTASIATALHRNLRQGVLQRVRHGHYARAAEDFPAGTSCPYCRDRDPVPPERATTARM